jgi:hypothetical protein
MMAMPNPETIAAAYSVQTSMAAARAAPPIAAIVIPSVPCQSHLARRTRNTLWANLKRHRGDRWRKQPEQRGDHRHVPGDGRGDNDSRNEPARSAIISSRSAASLRKPKPIARNELMVALKSRFTLKNPTGWKSQEGGPSSWHAAIGARPSVEPDEHQGALKLVCPYQNGQILETLHD